MTSPAFDYSPWRHGGWYTNVLYPSGACGCVSRNYADRKWRIACDPRPFESAPTFKSRDEAAAAEQDLIASTVVILTDRWGDDQAEHNASDDDRAAIERLLPLMWDELCFIAKRAVYTPGKSAHAPQAYEYGIVVEGEFDEGYVPTPAQVAAWRAAQPEGATFLMFHGDSVRPTFNDCWVAWAFFPEAMATAPAIEAAGRAYLNNAF